jgi:MoxR-like ATPase
MTDELPLFPWKKLEIEQRARPDRAVSYLYDDDLGLAVNVAMAAGRPLLLSGDAGTGKSTLAADVAWKLQRRFYTEVVTSRTKAQDLQWTFDAVRRLAVATSEEKDKAAQVANQLPFVKPGVLWRAFAPDSAARHGRVEGQEPPVRLWGDEGEHAVVLLDEIDKAEPDVPNDLLVVLDQREFVVRETGTPVAAPKDLQVLIVITTNGERDLPPAFMRRCISHTIKLPDRRQELEDRMRKIVERHFPKVDAGLFQEIHGYYDALRRGAKNVRQPSTAELLDAFRACEKLNIEKPGLDGVWRKIARKAIWKQGEEPVTTTGATSTAATAPGMTGAAAVPAGVAAAAKQ